MKFLSQSATLALPNRKWLLAVSYVILVLLMTNLNAIVDHYLHPEIPYFDEEHLFVGGATGLASALLFGLVLVYMYYLNKAMSKIQVLEKVLPICSHCKKIRHPELDPAKSESWETLETYIAQKTSSKFSHGICPDCFSRHYPEESRADQ